MELWSIPLIAWDPNWTALRLERELCGRAVSCLSFTYIGPRSEYGGGTYPRNDPTGVLTADAM